MDNSTLIVIAALCILLYFFLKKLSDAQRPIPEKQFEQAGVRVSFSNGTIAIDKNIYDVNQVTGIHLDPLESDKQRHSGEAKKVVIEIDDIRKPSYQVKFVTRAQAERFVPKLIMALKQAGSPKTI